MINKKNTFGVIFLVLIWLLPMFYTGITNKDVPFMPRTLSYFQRIALLFPHSINSWPLYYVQALPEDQQDWITLAEDEYFQLKPFGYRTRLHQLLYTSKDTVDYAYGKSRESLRREELAQWIHQRYIQLHPDRPQLKEIRFVAGFYNVRTYPENPGRWRKPALESFSSDQTYILSTHPLNDL